MVIHTKDGQDALKPQRAIYWAVRLGTGRHVGVRKRDATSPLVWFARHYERGRKPPQVQHGLGDFAHLERNERYGAAVKAANAWFEHVSVSGQSRAPSVEKACRSYLADALAERGKETDVDMEGHARRLIFNDPIAAVTLDKLTKSTVSAWRRRIVSRPIVSQKKGGKAKKSRPRSASTINRELGFIAAVLNHAFRNGSIAADVWSSVLQPIENADRSRQTYLSRIQREALIAELPKDFAAFVRALSLIPLRPGALAAAEVRDFDANRGTLFIRKDKAAAERTISLPASTVAFLVAQADGKKKHDPLFARADGAMLKKEDWKEPVRNAVARAELPPETVLYSVRHSVCTDLMRAGVDLFTLSKIAGTSVRMLERFYGKESQSHAAAALEKLA